MAVRDVVSLNCGIAGFVRDGLNDRALALYRWMVASGIRETPHTFSTILGACNASEGLQLHGRVLALGLCSNPFIASALVDLYMRVALPRAALSLFNELPSRSTAACNVMLRGFGSLKLTGELLCSFLDMRQQGLELNGLSFCYAMKGCYQSEEWLELGKQLHGLVLKAGWVPSNNFLSNSLVDLYSAIGNPADAMKALDDIPAVDVISWNSMVSVYAGKGDAEKAMDYFRRMLWHGKRPSSFAGLLAVSGQTVNLQLGVQVHGMALKLGFSRSSIHVQTALIDMYGKCSCFGSSLAIFNEILNLALECCNSMITSSLRCSVFDAASEILYCMFIEGVRPDRVTFSATIKAISLSASSGLISRQILHSCIVKLGFETDMAVCSSLITAYARAGELSSSHLIFASLQDPNVICFTAIISACAWNGDGARGMQLLSKMVCSGLKPDGVAFLCAIAGCDQAGLFEEGQLVIELMRASHDLHPDKRHLACMVNLLGRAGFVKEAMRMMEHTPPLQCHAKAWSSLLQSCTAHGENVMGKKAAETLMDVEPRDPSTSLQVSNFFSDIGEVENASRIREVTGGLKVRKIGHSMIEISGKA